MDRSGCPDALTRLRANKRDLGPLTGQDVQAPCAIVRCWDLYCRSDGDGQRAALVAMCEDFFACHALLGGMQPACWPLARLLIAHALVWDARDPLWPLVGPREALGPRGASHDEVAHSPRSNAARHVKRGTGVPVTPAAKRISLVLNSLLTVVEALDKLPSSKERSSVLDGVRDCTKAVGRWHQHPPTTEESEQVMSRIVKLLAAATWLLGRG